MKKFEKLQRAFGAIFLVAGTTIGAGMLAFPVMTGIAGFFPAIILFAIVWLFLTFSAFLFLEVNLCFPKDTNMVTMADKTLGKWGKYVCIVTYVLLLYSLVSAYLSGGAGVMHVLFDGMGFALPFWTETLLFVLLFGSAIYIGVKGVDFINRAFMLGLVVCYLALLFFATPHLNLNLLTNFNPKYLWLALSVVITAFGFHIIIPTLKDYLEGDVKKLKTTLLIGSLVPFVVYLIWNFVILAILPRGTLLQAYTTGVLPIESLKSILNAPTFLIFVSFFSFFAIVTSFLGVSLSLADFLADGLQIKKNNRGRFILCLLIFIPPLVFVLSGQKGFYIALEYAGAFVAILLGILPCLMALKNRKQHRKLKFKMFGGKGLRYLAIAFFSLVIVVNILQQFGYISLT
ncbi:MAG: Tyrosine-specific transport protein [Chlamydiae bacterium]|nr:Tyrosine-specific transport protein [Chlamydiota bacterium]